MIGDIVKVFILDYFFLILFISYKLISLTDKSIFYLESGSKLKKYIKGYDQQKLTTSLDNAKVNLKNSFILKKNTISPINYIKIINIIISTIALMCIKVSITFKYVFSNFVYIQILNKNIDIVSIFDDKYWIFIILYYILSAIFILNIILKISKKFNQKNNQEKEISNKEKVFLGINKMNNLPIYLNYSGLYQNILITGSIGSGKTSSGISNILDGLIKDNIVGLIIDIKGNYVNTLNKIAKKYGKSKNVIVISMDNDFKYNPLNKPDLSSSELASYMIRVLKVLSKGNNNSDPFWLDKSESFIRDFITLIRIYNDNFVNFMEIHKLVTNNSYIEEKLKVIKERILNNEYDDNKLFEINAAFNNIKNEYLKLDERVIGIIKAEITRLTNIFVTDYNIYNKFCTDNTYLNFLEDKIVVLSINIGKNRFLSKVISTYIKLDFQQQILSRINPQKPVFFVCDEFQEIVNFEDSNFFSISREYKAINVISVQSYNSLINSLQDNKSASVIIQNLVNKIWFRNDDIYTVKEIIKQLGKEEKNIETISYTESGQNSRYSLINKKFKDYKTGLSQSYTVNLKDEYKFNEEYITSKLNTFEAVCFLSDGNKIEIIERLKLKRWGEVYEKKQN